VLDKTGTVTKGKPELTDIFLEGVDETEALRLIGAAEKHSEHPLANAIVTAIVAKGISITDTDKFEAIPGYGIRAVVEGQEVLIGTSALMQREGIAFSQALEVMARLESEAKTAMLVALNKRYIGIIAVADTIKESSMAAIGRLKKLGLQVIMMTGDNQRTAHAIANEVGIAHILAEILPNDKAMEIKKLQARGEKVAMVGDGINDAPALVTADVGIAIGTGADIAMEAADITLMSGDLNGIAEAIHISRKTMINIKQNLFWALAYNLLGIPIAAMGLLAPWVAGAAMAFSSVSVVLNALRLQRMTIGN
jgi:P-type Cu+ transporter